MSSWSEGLTGYPRDNGRKGIRNLVAVVAAADNVNPLVRQLARRVHAGLPLGQWYPALASCVSLAVTEKRSRGEIDGLVSAYEAELSAGGSHQDLRKKVGETLLA